MIGIKIRELREERGLLLRQVAATLEIDTATLSKMEREVKTLRKEHLQKLANIYEIDVVQLIAIWLADKLINILEDEEEEISKKALMIVIEQITR
jgi:transcriptional regulator with XRE-family HTH domain